jgi:hypothetical protein
VRVARLYLGKDEHPLRFSTTPDRRLVELGESGMVLAEMAAPRANGCSRSP